MFISCSFNRLFEYCSLNPFDDKKVLKEESIVLSSLTKPEDVIDQIIRSRLDKMDESNG